MSEYSFFETQCTTNCIFMYLINVNYRRWMTRDAAIEYLVNYCSTRSSTLSSTQLKPEVEVWVSKWLSYEVHVYSARNHAITHQALIFENEFVFRNKISIWIDKVPKKKYWRIKGTGLNGVKITWPEVEMVTGSSKVSSTSVVKYYLSSLLL